MNLTPFCVLADGTDVHPVIASPQPGAAYTIADWSWDGTRLLVNKTGTQPVMQIVDLRTGATTDVAEGTAASEGWYHYRDGCVRRDHRATAASRNMRFACGSYREHFQAFAGFVAGSCFPT